MNLEDIFLSEISQTQKNKYTGKKTIVISLMCVILKSNPQERVEWWLPWQDFLFKRLCNIPCVCVCTHTYMYVFSLSIPPWVNTEVLRILVIVDNATQSEVARLYVFKCLRNLHAVSQSHQFTVSPVVYEGSVFSTSSPTCVILLSFW